MKKKIWVKVNMICAGFMLAMLLPLYSPINSCTHTHTLNRKSQRFHFFLLCCYSWEFQIKKKKRWRGMWWVLLCGMSPPSSHWMYYSILTGWMSTSYRDLKVNRVQFFFYKNGIFQGFFFLENFPIFLPPPPEQNKKNAIFQSTKL